LSTGAKVVGNLSTLLIGAGFLFLAIWLVHWLQSAFGKGTAAAVAKAAAAATGAAPGAGVVNIDATSPDPVVRAIFSSGDGSKQNWVPKWLGGDGGDFNDGSGQGGNLWAAFKQAFGIADSPTASTAPDQQANLQMDFQGAQEVGLYSFAPGSAVTSDPLADQFNLAAPLQGGA
jgi:hypothetical protein